LHVCDMTGGVANTFGSTTRGTVQTPAHFL
jgi:hypothetical protein